MYTRPNGTTGLLSERLIDRPSIHELSADRWHFTPIFNSHAVAVSGVLKALLQTYSCVTFDHKEMALCSYCAFGYRQRSWGLSAGGQSA